MATKMMDGEPTELVSCGKCSAVNTVPFGLDKFKCYKCNVLVAVAREPSAACAAVSATAQYYNELEASGGHMAASNSGGSSTTTAAAAPSTSDAVAKKKPSEGGFFGKLQKTMDKTMAKMDKTLQNLTNPKPASDAAVSAASTPTGTAARANQRLAAAPPTLSSEDAELQWALQASLGIETKTPASAMMRPANSARDGQVATTMESMMMDIETASLESSATSSPVNKAAAAAPSGKPPGASAAAAATSANANAGDQLQAVASQVALRLQRAEERASLAERALAAIQTREAAAVAETAALQQQLADNESLVRGLTEQLDAANSQLEDKVKYCRALEEALASAQQAAAAAAEAVASKEEGAEGDQLDRQGTIAQLLARIAELESTLLHATHFAPETEKDFAAEADSPDAVKDEVPSTENPRPDADTVSASVPSTEGPTPVVDAPSAAASAAAPAAAAAAAPAQSAAESPGAAGEPQAASEPQTGTQPQMAAEPETAASGTQAASELQVDSEPQATVQPAPTVLSEPAAVAKAGESAGSASTGEAAQHAAATPAAKELEDLLS